jgi:hypothetical protein
MASTHEFGSDEAGAVSPKIARARAHISPHMFTAGHISIQANRIGERHPILSQNGRGIGKAEFGLRVGNGGNQRVGTDAELSGSNHQAYPGRIRAGRAMRGYISQKGGGIESGERPRNRGSLPKIMWLLGRSNGCVIVNLRRRVRAESTISHLLLVKKALPERQRIARIKML